MTSFLFELGETLHGTAEALRLQVRTVRAFMIGKEQELEGKVQECSGQINDIIRRARTEFGAAASQQAWPQDRSDKQRARGFIDIEY